MVMAGNLKVATKKLMKRLFSVVMATQFLLACDGEVKVNEAKIDSAGAKLQQTVEKGVDSIGAKLDRLEDKLDKDDTTK